MIPSLYTYGVVCLIAVSGLVLGYQKVWDRGYAARVADEVAVTEQRISAAVEAARVQWKQSAQVGAAQIQQEQKIVERIRYVDREIPNVVALAGDCRDLGPAFLRVFNAAIQAGNGDSGGPPEPPREPIDRMPALPARPVERSF